MFKFFVPFALVVLFSSISFSQQDLQKEKDLLMKTDSDFSKLSEEKGANAAFISYAADDVTLLRPNNSPLQGKQAMIEQYKKRNDSTFTLIWKPTFADVSTSGELGYTYGTYELKSRPVGKFSGEGTYVTIWKKDKDGNWKFVLDAGNEGLKPKKQN